MNHALQTFLDLFISQRVSNITRHAAQIGVLFDKPIGLQGEWV
jgi:hypothetical protein